jgi:hypothetical protein
MERTPTDDHVLELGEGRTIGYATWGDPDGLPCSSATERRDRA